MEYGSMTQGPSQAKGVRQLLGQGDRRVAPLQGLVWIAEIPQSNGCMSQATHSGVLYGSTVSMRSVPLRVVKSNPLFKVLSARGKLSRIEQSHSQQIVSWHETGRVLYPLGQSKALLP